MNLNIKNLTVDYNGQQALDELSLVLDGRHTVVIIGPSGGGKSTLLRILAGVETPTNGDVLINGKTMEFHEKWLKTYRTSIGMVYQAFNLFPHLTALQNITLPLIKVHNKTAAEAQDISMKLLQRFDLSDHADKKPAQLSGGQQQRISIARAMAINPEVLMLDEPTSALDPQLTREVLDMVKDLADDGMDIIMVTHEMSFARMAADYVLFIANGKVAEHNRVDEFFDNPKTKELKDFFGSVI